MANEDREAARRLAIEIADALGEHGAEGQAPRARVEAQLARMALLMGDDWVRGVGEMARIIHRPSYEIASRKDGGLRTLGGTFFAEARRQAWPGIAAGTFTKRVFLATFCWREKRPMPPVIVPPPSDRLPPDPVLERENQRRYAAQASPGNVRKRRPTRPVEVYVRTSRRGD